MTTNSKTIDPSKLIPMDLCAQFYPLQVQLAYAHDKAPNIFGKIYHDDAKLWLHEDLAKIVCLAAKNLNDETGYNLVLYDGLRTHNAQAEMAEADIVKANPQWMEEPRLLSPPGAGAHPRGMAIDISVLDENGHLIDMGTDFDHLAEEQGAEKNPAHRSYKKMGDEHAKNRALLTDPMVEAAKTLEFNLVAYPEEWWDFRFERDFYEEYAPLYDDALPAEMRMVTTEAIDDFDDVYTPRVQKIVDDLSIL